MAKAKDKREKRKAKYSTTKQRMENRGDTFVSTTVKVPDGMEMFKFQLDGDKKKKYLLDIIPYTAGENNPVVDEGVKHWERTYYVHKNVGPQGKWYVCPTSTWGEDHKCPICEHAAKLRRSGQADKEALKEFKPSKRQLFYIKDRLEKGGKPRLLDIHAYMKDDTAFGQLIDGMLENKMDEPDHKYHNFFHLEDGMSIEVMSKKHILPDGSFVSNGSTITFEDRKKQYDEDAFSDLPSLDDLLIEPDYDKMKKAFLEGGIDGEEEEEEKPKKGKKKKEEEDEEESDGDDEDEGEEDEGDDEEGEENEDEEEEDDSALEGEDEEEEEEEEEKPKKGKKGKKKKEEDDGDEDADEEDEEGEEDDEDSGDEEDDESEDEDEGDDEEEEEEDEKPKKKGKKAVKKGKKKEEEEEEESEDDEDDDDAPWDDDSEDEEDEESEDEEEE